MSVFEPPADSSSVFRTFDNPPNPATLLACTRFYYAFFLCHPATIFIKNVHRSNGRPPIDYFECPFELESLIIRYISQLELPTVDNL